MRKTELAYPVTLTPLHWRSAYWLKQHEAFEFASTTMQLLTDR